MSAEPDQWWAAELLDRERWRDVVEPFLGRAHAALERGRFPASLLVVGVPGLGRELAAAELAAMLVCPTSAGPWCSCSACDRARRGIHPDVSVLLPRGASRTIQIEQIRGLVESVAGRPYEAVRRVWVVDGAESGRLGGEAANAFLKTLEEPPEHAVLVLLAANPAAVLPTIRSRCQQLALPAAITVADRLARDAVPPELASALAAGAAVETGLDLARTTLGAAQNGEVLDLLRLATALADEAAAFSVIAAAALELVDSGEGDAEGLVHLAADLVATERRVSALNLNRERQLLSCLLRWHREG